MLNPDQKALDAVKKLIQDKKDKELFFVGYKVLDENGRGLYSKYQYSFGRHRAAEWGGLYWTEPYNKWLPSGIHIYLKEVDAHSMIAIDRVRLKSLGVDCKHRIVKCKCNWKNVRAIESEKAEFREAVLTEVEILAEDWYGCGKTMARVLAYGKTLRGCWLGRMETNRR